MRNKVIIIGLDGATFELLGRWMDSGHLPHLKALRDEGVSGELQSSVPPVTAPAWASFMTGKNPGKHGIFDFVVQDEQSYQFRPVNAQFLHEKTLWEVIGEQGGRVVVLNVPLTHPPKPVSGALISDFLLATRMGGASYPPDLLADIEARFGPYPSDTVVPFFMATQADEDVHQFITGYTEALTYKFQVSRFLLNQLDPDFLMLHLYGNDQICHWLWYILDETHPSHNQAAVERHYEKILDYYRTLDTEVGRLLNEIDARTSLLIISDHGFGPVYKAIDLNTWLYQEGYLALKDNLLTTLRRGAWKAGVVPDSFMGAGWIKKGLAPLARRLLKNRGRGGIDQVKWAHKLSQLLLSFNDVDWSRTRAFSPFGFGQIRINVRGKWAQGCVSPGAEYEGLKREIAEKLRSLKDPETGAVLDCKVVKKEEVYSGDFFDQAPDIFIIPTQGRYRPKSMGFTSNRVVSPFWGMTGIHKMNGILLGRGGALDQAVRIEGAQITDLFPSILYLLEMDIPQDVDGTVLESMVERSFRESHATRFSSASKRDGPSAPITPTGEDGEQVLERLRSLGYLD